MKLSNYYIKAKLLPTILCSAPIMCLYYYGLNDDIKEFLTFISGIEWVADVTITVALIYLMIEVNRFISKEVFQRLFFKDEMKMPTTEYLLIANNELANDVQKSLRNKIESNYGVKLLNEIEEKENEQEARKLIIAGVAHIRNETRGNKLLLQHNIEFGFVRNFIGGCLFALLIGGLNLFYFTKFECNSTAFNITVASMIIYIIPVLMSGFLIRRYGHYYAKVLFEQFNSTK